MTDILDDDIEMDRMMNLSDEELEAEMAQVMKEYDEWWDSLTSLQQYRVSRRSSVASAAGFRRIIRDQGLTFMKEYLRNTQKRMWAMRYWHRTGVMPSLHN